MTEFETPPYRMLIKFDKENEKYVIEIPELVGFEKIEASTREEAMEIADHKIQEHIRDFENRQEQAPEPLDIEETSGQLFLHLSPMLYRDLIFQSKIEKVPIEELAKEILARGIEIRKSGGRPQHRGGGRDHRMQRGHGRNYHQTMEKKENFLEYVRSLEKGRGRKR